MVSVDNIYISKVFEKITRVLMDVYRSYILIIILVVDVNRSESFKDFVRVCLVKNPKERSSAESLLQVRISINSL